MLILTRKLGESIIIGDDIKVTFLSILGRQIRIGIDAPPEIPVHREEVADKIAAEKATNKKRKGGKILSFLHRLDKPK